MRTLIRALLVPALALGAAIVVAAPSAAHPMPHSIIELTVGPETVKADLELPIEDLALALGDSPVDSDGALLPGADATLSDYLSEHVRITSPDGAAWETAVTTLSVSEAEQTSTGPYQEVIAEATLTPPSSTSTRDFTLWADPILHQVLTHQILVTVASDWAGGTIEEVRELGVIKIHTGTGEIAPLELNLGSGSAWNGFSAMFELGTSHILEGTDHLLFLLVLLLPAPLLAARGRWLGPVAPRRAVQRIVLITLAFTIGHSLTLVIASLARLDIAPGPVEALIALSILIGAVHALRPLFPGKEAWVAGIFGLIHGTAFSFTLAELSLGTWQLVISLFAFNLGIEAMQLLIVALVLPGLVIASRSHSYSVFRCIAAGVTAVAAVGWLLDRVGVPNLVADLADGIVDFQVYVLVAIWVYALATWLLRRAGRGAGGGGERRRAEIAGDLAHTRQGCDDARSLRAAHRPLKEEPPCAPQTS